MTERTRGHPPGSGEQTSINDEGRGLWESGMAWRARSALQMLWSENIGAES